MTIPEGTNGLLEGIAKVILAIGGVITGGVAFLKIILPWAERRSGTANGLDQLQVLHDTMRDAIKAGAERVIVFYGHNSGGIPQPGSPFYATAVHWEKRDGYGKMHGKPEESIRDYASLPVDGACIEMLNTMRQHGCYRFTTSEEDEHSMLRKIYENTGVTDALLVYLGIFRKRIYYVSFAKYSKMFSEEEITALRLKANLIQAIIAKAQK